MEDIIVTKVKALEPLFEMVATLENAHVSSQVLSRSLQNQLSAKSDSCANAQNLGHSCSTNFLRTACVPLWGDA